MIDIENRFKRWLAGEGPRPPSGTWLMAAAPATAEAMGYAGFDFLVVDMEHVPIEVSDLTHILRAIGCTPADAVVRLAWNDQVLIKRVLDAGAQTIMVPFVQTAEEARQAVSFAKYPPEGVRGRGGRSSRLALRARNGLSQASQWRGRGHRPARNARGDRAAAGNRGGPRRRCASSSGPAILSAAMGHIGNIAHPDVQALIEKRREGSRVQPESRSASSGPIRTWFVASSITVTTLPPSPPISP